MRFKAHASFLEDFERKQGKRKSRLQGLVMAATAVLISVWSPSLGMPVSMPLAVLSGVCSKQTCGEFSLGEERDPSIVTTPLLLHGTFRRRLPFFFLRVRAVFLFQGRPGGDTHSLSPSLSEPGTEKWAPFRSCPSSTLQNEIVSEGANVFFY